MLAALAAASEAADPVERFPFLVLDPEAVPRRRPDAPEPTGLELDLTGVRPGPELARLLTTVDPAEVTDWMLVELTAAAVRLTSWAQAVAAHLAGTLATRESMGVDDLRVVGGPTPDQVAGTELALRMSWTRSSATTLVRRGRAFDGALAATGAALARGEIDAVRADAVVRRLADAPVPVALDVQDAVLPRATGRTAPQLRTDLERALIETDPDDAGERRVRAHATRRVERPTVLPDGMSCLRAVLPAADAVRMHTVLDAAARTARSVGDPRTLDQLRADGLVDLVLHDACDPPGAAAAPAASHESAGPDVPPASPASVARPAPSAPPVPAPPVVLPAQAASPLVGAGAAPRGAGAPLDPATGSTADAASSAATLSGPVVPARGKQPLVPAGGPTAAETGRAEAAAPPAGREVRGAVAGACRARRRPDALVRVTVAPPTLLGLDDRPAELEGYGPVHAATARALAAGGVLQRLVTDPLSGTLLDLGRKRYRPTTALAEHVRARDATCVRPGCSVPARSCDLDHVRDYGQRPRDGGPPGGTSHDNLACLCSTDHRMKTRTGFRLRQRAPGVFQWVTPTGHVYDVDRAVLDPPAVLVPGAAPDSQADPGPPGDPEPSAAPGASVVLTSAVIPRGSEVPTTPVVPGLSEVVRPPVVPGSPEVVGGSVVPGSPVVPGLSEVVGGSVVPGRSVVPGSPEVARPPVVPRSPEVVGGSVVPGPPLVPGSPEGAGGSEVPGSSVEPGSPLAPGRSPASDSGDHDRSVPSGPAPDDLPPF